MEIQQKIVENELIIFPNGRLDASTCDELEEWFDEHKESGQSYRIDLCDLEYISSAGLRVLLSMHKYCKANSKKMIIINCNEVVKDIFKITGFVNMLNIK